MLADFVETFDKLNLLDKITEPKAGDPFLVNYHGCLISQDAYNSIHKFYSTTTVCNPTKTEFLIAELDAGYGQLRYVYLSALPNVSNRAIDTPPALYISQRYLTEIFPDQPIFKFREFSSHEHVRIAARNDTRTNRQLHRADRPTLPGKHLFKTVDYLTCEDHWFHTQGIQAPDLKQLARVVPPPAPDSAHGHRWHLSHIDHIRYHQNPPIWLTDRRSCQEQVIWN